MRVVVVALVAVAVSVGAAPSAGEVLSQRLLHVAVSGRLTVRFHGEPSAGCATVGLCVVSGRIVWQPSGPATLAITEERIGRRRVVDTALVFHRAMTRALVRRTLPTGGSITCTDSTGDESPAIFGRAPQSRLVLGLRSDRAHAIPVTRCAGPLDRDLRAGLPERRVSVAALMRGGTTVPLRSVRSFVARGLAGSVRSSLRLRLGRPSPRQVPAPSPRRRTPLETLRATYRVTSVSGAMRATFSARPGRCVALGACGLGGSLTIASPAGHGFFELEASAPAPRPVRDLRAALGLGRGHPHGVEVVGFGFWFGGSATEEVAWPDGGRCRDQVRTERGGQQSVVDVLVGSRRLEASYGEFGDTEPDPMRTHCPGPGLGDLDGDRPFAAGYLPLRELRHRRVLLRLNRSAPLDEDGPWAGSISSTIAFELRRTRVRLTESRTGA